jgi:hypothetical protein
VSRVPIPEIDIGSRPENMQRGHIENTFSNCTSKPTANKLRYIILQFITQIKKENVEAIMR